jgi:hypothetical protein
LPAAPPLDQSIWFICDGVDAPALFALERNGQAVRISEYDKPNGAIMQRLEFTLGADDGAAGSVYSALLDNGAEAGAVRRTNPGMLETPGAAYTQRYTEVRLGDRIVSCRWLPRTRLFGFTGRRSFVVHEDADGDLIYSTFDFSEAATARRFDLSENGISTPFSLEVRGGEESATAEGVTYRFRGRQGYAYVITANRSGEGALEVLRGNAVVQSEPLIAFQIGEAASE